MSMPTWGELADWYDNHIGGPAARTIDMNEVIDKCVATGHFTVTPDGDVLRVEVPATLGWVLSRTPNRHSYLTYADEPTPFTVEIYLDWDNPAADTEYRVWRGDTLYNTFPNMDAARAFAEATHLLESTS